MLITLNNSRTVDISWEEYDAMSPQQYNDFMNSNYGESIQDPFFGSQIDIPSSRKYAPRADDDGYQED